MISIPWSVVRAPKIIPVKRPPIEVGAISRLDDLESREREIEGQNRRRLGFGCIIVALIVGIVIPVIFRWILHVHSIAANAQDVSLRDIQPLIAAIDVCLLAVTFPIAALTAPKSRAQRINQFIESGTRCSGANDNVLIRIVVMLLMLGLLFGEFLVIDAIRSHWLRIRLRHVDRHRAALILQMLVNNPCGIDPRFLVRVGENPMHFRTILAYLMAYEWADISCKGDCLTLLSPAKRELKHAAEGFFAAAVEP
jgi:hypothetical protein